MLLKPRLEDIRNIEYYLGKILIGLGLLMVLPVIFGLCVGEIEPALDFGIGLQVSLLAGLILILAASLGLSAKDKAALGDLNWMQGMIVVSLSWLAAMLLSALPMYLSGHWGCYLDACFDAMSGFATTGLTLINDLDHLALTHNLWRHLMMFAGGQGIVIIVLSFFLRSSSGAFKMYVGEARDERVLPNVIHTSRFIWMVSLVYLVLGTLILGAICIFNGMSPFRSFFHGACIFMAAFDTGGFAPQSQSILYYHNFYFEFVTIVIMVFGALNFKLHYHLWTGNRRELMRNIESVTLFMSVLVLFSMVAVGLKQAGIYPDAVVMLRKGFYQLISAHTGTGYTTLYPRQFFLEWGSLAYIGVVFAMALGGSICSTTGGIKMMRVGVILKGLMQDIKKIILPERAVIVKKIHHIKDIFLEDRIVRSALFITLSYLMLYWLGAVVGMIYGYSFLESLFESTSAAANVGLSCGITNPAMPGGLKFVYILQMWSGRLEFMSVFTLAGFFIAAIRGK